MPDPAPPNAEQSWRGFLGELVWKYRREIAGEAERLYAWVRGRFQKPADGGEPDRPSRPILIIGPGGVGKSTLLDLLAGNADRLAGGDMAYRESLSVEQLSQGAGQPFAAVVVPGQPWRRQTWAEPLHALAAGEFRGVVFVGAFGYHSMIVPRRSHHFHRPRQRVRPFLDQYLAAQRADELVLDRTSS